jgi:hypothetical protein
MAKMANNGYPLSLQHKGGNPALSLSPPKEYNMLKVNQEVRIHPATDLFMRGVTHANVTKIGRKWIHLLHWRSRTKHKVSFRFAANYFM